MMAMPKSRGSRSMELNLSSETPFEEITLLKINVLSIKKYATSCLTFQTTSAAPLPLN